MKTILLLWVMQIASVTSLKIVPFRVREFTRPILDGPASRIYGGGEAEEGEFPFMILILLSPRNDKRNRCSSSLVTPDWVLTAAHCLSFPELYLSNIILVGGKANLDDYAMERFKMGWNDTISEDRFHVQERRVEKYLIHPEYTVTDEEMIHDVALIKTREPFTAEFIKTIPLSYEKINEKKKCTILGWGMTQRGENNHLNVVREKEISTTEIGCEFIDGIPVICLNPDGLTGICGGDSGSPLVCDGKVWGVASYMLTVTDECGDALEDYYAELSVEEQWVQSIIGAGIRSVQINLSEILVCVCASVWMSQKILS